MTRVLRRPMFRIGGVAEGITSGLDRTQLTASDQDMILEILFLKEQKNLFLNIKKLYKILEENVDLTYHSF